MPTTMSPEAAYSMSGDIAQNIIARIQAEARCLGHGILLNGDYLHELARGVFASSNNEELYETVLAWLDSECVDYAVGQWTGALAELEPDLPDIRETLATAGVAPYGNGT
jgi:hypothetical protein